MEEPKLSKVSILVIGLLLVLMVIFYTQKEYLKKWGFLNIEAPVSLLEIGTNLWFGYQPLYLARSLGYYENTPIRLVEYASATQAIRAYRNNAIQATTLTLDEVLLLLEVGLDPRVILVVDISNGGDVIIAKPEIKNLSDLKGHKVGVENTALGAFFLTRALEAVGLEISDVNVIHSEIDEQESMFLRGDFDAIVTFEPVRSRLLATGAHEVFDSSQIPGEIVDLLVVSNNVLERYPEKVTTLLEGWFRTLDYIKTQPKDAAIKMAPQLNISTEEILIAYENLVWPDLEENLRLMDGPEPPLLKTATKLADKMLQSNLLQREVVFTDFINSSVLKRIRDSASKPH